MKWWRKFRYWRNDTTRFGPTGKAIDILASIAWQHSRAHNARTRTSHYPSAHLQIGAVMAGPVSKLAKSVCVFRVALVFAPAILTVASKCSTWFA